MTRKITPAIRDTFNMTADEPGMKASNDIRPAETFSRAASPTLETDRHLARPSVPERAKGLDYSGKTMGRYINGLETRLIDHMRKHAPRWQQKGSRSRPQYMAHANSPASGPIMGKRP